MSGSSLRSWQGSAGPLITCNSAKKQNGAHRRRIPTWCLGRGLDAARGLAAGGQEASDSKTHIRTMLSDTADLAGQLERSLRAEQKEQATQQYTKLKQSCTQCHKSYRD